jgi:hypothetical protein
MSPDFRNYTHEMEVEFGKHLFPIGGMLEDGSKKMVAEAFQDMVIISSPDEAKAQKVDVVMAPHVEAAEYEGYKRASFTDPPISMVLIKWTASDPEGNIIWANTFEGKGQIKRVKGVRPTNKYGIVTDNMGLAIKDSLRKAYEEILSSTWWRTIKK